MTIKVKPNQKIYILDTSVVLNSPQSLLGFEDNMVVLTTTLLEELDVIKDKVKSVSVEARAAIRMISDIVSGSSADELTEGVVIETSFGVSGTIVFVNDVTISVSNGPELNGTFNDNDNRFIHTAMYLAGKHPENKVAVVTLDVNLRLKSKLFGVLSEEYFKDKTVSDIDLLYKGYCHVEHAKDIENIDTSGKVSPLVGVSYQGGVENFPKGLLLNEYLIFPDKSVGYVTFVNDDIVKWNHMTNSQIMSIRAFDVVPQSLEQAIVMHQSLREDLDLNIITGSAGCGKTYLAVAAALDLVSREDTPFDRIIVARTNDQMDSDIGFLKGTLEEKVGPLLVGVTDSLYNLVKQDEKQGAQRKSTEATVEYMMEMHRIEFRAINYLRGASLSGSIIIFDEMQNATIAQVKGMLSRPGKDTKTFVLGNLNQIDNNQYVTPLTSGLTRCVDVYKDFYKCGVMQMSKVVRSELAEFTENNF